MAVPSVHDVLLFCFFPWSPIRPRQDIFEKPGKNSLSLKQLAGLFKNTLTRPAFPI
jgi:hypothetical protein